MNKQEPQKKFSGIGIILTVLMFALWLGFRMMINPGGSGTGDFFSYRGPVLPMTSLGSSEGVDVTRNVDFNFSPYEKDIRYGNISKGAAGITDTYTLTNTSGQTKQIDLVYGFQGQFIDQPDEFPTITIDGTIIQPKLYPAVDPAERLWNANSFEQYSQILSEQDFLTTALQASEKLDTSVTAYHFTNLCYDNNEPASDPMLVLQYTKDDQTSVWTAIADVYGTEDDGNPFMMFRVDRGEAWVFTVGGTLMDIKCSGNKDYNINENSAISGVTYELETYETTLSDVIEQAASNYDFWSIEGQNSYPNPGGMTTELLVSDTVKRIHALDYLESTEQIRILESIFYEVITESRMLYLVFPVELNAGQSVTVEASYVQEPSLDISGPKEYREGYDLATKLGSDLNFTALTASLSRTDLIELGKQNFGFDLDKGITNVTLDLQEERYYLEVKPK